MLNGMEAKSQGKDREEKERSNKEFRVSRWKGLR